MFGFVEKQLKAHPVAGVLILGAIGALVIGPLLAPVVAPVTNAVNSVANKFKAAV